MHRRQPHTQTATSVPCHHPLPVSPSKRSSTKHQKHYEKLEKILLIYSLIRETSFGFLIARGSSTPLFGNILIPHFSSLSLPNPSPLIGPIYRDRVDRVREREPVGSALAVWTSIVQSLRNASKKECRQFASHVASQSVGSPEGNSRKGTAGLTKKASLQQFQRAQRHGGEHGTGKKTFPLLLSAETTN